MAGQHISTLADEDCEDISDTFIPVYRETPDGGTLTLMDGSTSYANCAGNIVFDVVHSTSAPNLSYWYIITDNNDNILATHNSDDGSTLDLSGAPAGECRIWGWNYSGTTSPVAGQHISTLADEDCEDITNDFITINRLDCSECTPVTNIQHELMAPAKCRITWDALPNQVRWDVHYRIQGTASWTRIGALNSEKTLHFLAPNTVYEYIVRPYCGTWDFALASPIRRFNTANIPNTFARQQVLDNSSINVFPNPTRNLLTVNFSTETLSDVNLSIMDMTGKLVHEVITVNTKDNHTKTLDVSRLEQGYYLIVMQTNGERIIRKFAKIQ